MNDRDSGLGVSDEQILTVFAETEQTPLYAWEVADELAAEEDVVGDQLVDLEERGLVESDDEFAPGTVWRVPEDADVGAELAGEDATDDTDTEAQAVDARTTSLPRDFETVESPPPEPGEEVAWREYEPPTDPVASFDPPGTPEQKGRRRAALRHAYGYLREHGPATRDELVENVYPDYRGAYDSPAAGWWDVVIEPGFEQLPDVERTAEGGWAVTGTDAGPPGETV